MFIKPFNDYQPGRRKTESGKNTATDKEEHATLIEGTGKSAESE